ncbi:MAG: hypothetical protein N3A59_01705 [Thermodesulfovibrionales bacterium]|nr:hypothetical protein [Thermodesulfovibrionales bacterium]
MEISREIRAFYIKLPTPSVAIKQKISNALWSLARGLHICTIEINNNEILIHSEVEFSIDNWEASVKYLKSILSLLHKKSGYIIIRKIKFTQNSLKTDLESYKITKRGIYLSDPPDSPLFIADLIKFSGRNKTIQFVDSLSKILKAIENNPKERDFEEL